MALVGSTMVTWRRGGVSIAVALGLGSFGCSRVNPSFGDDDGPTSSGASPDDTGATDSSPPTAPADSTGGGKGGTSDGADDPATTDAPDSTTSVGTGDPPTSESSGGNPVMCEVPEAAPIEMTIIAEGGALMPLPGDCNLVLQRPNGMISMVAGSLSHQICDGCNCLPAPGLTLDFGGTLVPPPLPECGKLVAWSAHGPDGVCRWDGFAVIGQFETVIPHYVAANSRLLPEEPFGPVTVGLAEDVACDGVFGCTPGPGTYGLTFFDGGAVFMGASSIVTIGFFAAVDYLVHTRTATIDSECGEHVAWTALVQG